MPKLEKGIWIALEGGDGSGKSTVMERLGATLMAEGFSVALTREPGGNPYSEEVRKLIFSSKIKDDPKSQLLAFVLARRRNIIETVIPALDDQKIILSDRSEGSTYAYQVFEYGLSFEEVARVNNYATDSLKPDLTVLLDVDIQTGIERVQKAKSIDANYFDHQQLEALERRANGYRELAKNYAKYNLNPWVIINANQPLKEVIDQTHQAITAILTPAN